MTDEHATITIRDTGLSLVGTMLGAHDGVPLRLEYRVLTNAAGITTAAHVRSVQGFEQRVVSIERTAKGAWSVDGQPDRSLKGCADVDLGFTPSTNTLPIRRLRHAVGGAQTIQAAWLRFPELTVERSAQSYTRLDEFTYRYESGTFSAQLTVDDDGLVASYAVWQRTGLAIGPDETAPLDALR